MRSSFSLRFLLLCVFAASCILWICLREFYLKPRAEANVWSTYYVTEAILEKETNLLRAELESLSLDLGDLYTSGCIANGWNIEFRLHSMCDEGSELLVYIDIMRTFSGTEVHPIQIRPISGDYKERFLAILEAEFNEKNIPYCVED